MRETSFRKNLRRAPWIVSAGLGLAMGGGIALATGVEPGPDGVAVAPQTSGSNYGPFTVEVEPVEEDGTLEFDVMVQSRFDRNSVVESSYQIIDENGRAVQSPLRSGLVKVAKAGESFDTIEAPDGLRDGYYMLRVTTAGADGEQDGVVQTERFFRVVRGVARPVTSNEWFTKSNANKAQSTILVAR